MNIIIASDSNYLNPAKVLIKSLADNNAEPIDVYILQSEISLSQQQCFTRECSVFSNKLTIRFIEVNDALFDGMPSAFGLPNTSYYRFTAADLLPESIDRALYLDCDIIVNSSIHEFYNMDFENNLFIACEDIGVSVLGKYKFLSVFGRLNKELHNDKYFNSGVLLMNMPLVRSMIHLDEVFEVVGKYRNDLTFADQDILNFMYGMHTKYADYKIYNMGAAYITPENEDWAMENSAIIHYYGGRDSKPWLFKEREKIDSGIIRLWWKYGDYFDEYRMMHL
jgi:lipopolysaccharide biosynthesis glycosyltransferase